MRVWGWSAAAYCDATGNGESAGLRCDLNFGHDGLRHIEKGVATWMDDGSDVRWFVGESKAGRDVYRADAVTS